MTKLISTLLFYPEAVFDVWFSRLTAYFLLYLFPFFLTISTISAFMVAGLSIWTAGLFGVFVICYTGVMIRFVYIYYSKLMLQKAAIKPLPRAVKRYFSQSYPGVYLPIRVSPDRKQWVAYDHVPKIDMVRTITYLDYYLMPPIKDFRTFYMENMDQVKHKYLSIVDAENEEFIFSDHMTPNSYRVTVFDEDEITK